MNIPSPLGNLSAEAFLAEYWQKKPLLIKQAISCFEDPLSPEEIAGLACEEFIESRLIFAPQEAHDWQLEHGPFTPEQIAALPSSHWTLHIQGLENYFRSIYQLLDYFCFIPRWRLDDIMVSYSVNKGSAGPHFDYYDVFLLQTQGHKRWQLGQHCTSASALVAGIDLKILQSIEVQEEFVAEPGDLLYIPPQIAHYGRSHGESVTYSVGFRAPSAAELVQAYADHLCKLDDPSDRYSDSDLVLAEAGAEFGLDACVRVQNLVQQSFQTTAVPPWFGRYITEPKTRFDDIEVPTPIAPVALQNKLAHHELGYWLEGTRVAYAESADQLLLFINGEVYELPRGLDKFVRCLTEHTCFRCQDLLPFINENAITCLATLYNAGLIQLKP